MRYTNKGVMPFLDYFDLHVTFGDENSEENIFSVASRSNQMLLDVKTRRII